MKNKKQSIDRIIQEAKDRIREATAIALSELDKINKSMSSYFLTMHITRDYIRFDIIEKNSYNIVKDVFLKNDVKKKFENEDPAFRELADLLAMNFETIDNAIEYIYKFIKG